MIRTILLGVLLTQPTTSEDTKSDIPTLAREYRIAVYDSFRTQRDQYDQWREAGDIVLDAVGGIKGDQQRERLADWFRQGRLAAESSNGSAPPVPAEFTQAAEQAKKNAYKKRQFLAQQEYEEPPWYQPQTPSTTSFVNAASGESSETSSDESPSVLKKTFGALLKASTGGVGSAVQKVQNVQQSFTPPPEATSGELDYEALEAQQQRAEASLEDLKRMTQELEQQAEKWETLGNEVEATQRSIEQDLRKEILGE